VSELGQSWHLPNMDEFSLKFQSTPLSAAEFLGADPHVRPRVLADFDETRHDDFLTDIEDLVARLHGHGLELLVLDLTRPDVGFSVARAIVPGLVHFWPRLGCRRLYEVPQAQGWVSQPVGEDDLNPIPFFW
jgi:ribosomal protein S12 methylthiotransferase accessory factor